MSAPAAAASSSPPNPQQATAVSATTNNTGSAAAPECPLCSDSIPCYGVFNCGHYACYKCALRIRRSFRRETSNSSNNQQQHRGVRGRGNNSTQQQQQQNEADSSHNKAPPGCHVCRKEIQTLTITEMPPRDADSMVYDKNELAIINKHDGLNAKKFLPLNCFVTSDACAARLMQLISYVCPFPQCWSVDPATGARGQEPFNNLDGLQKHLRVDHHGAQYCSVCVQQGYKFLSELPTYQPSELGQHIKGMCANKDVAAFGGHPQCHFCHNKFVYDGDAMLEHLKHVHYVCDFCNINAYKFCYYNDRESLNMHWSAVHKLCTHSDCVNLDPSERVFSSELELARHMQTRHGVKQKVSLDSLGFTSNSDAMMTGRRGNAAAAAAAANGVQQQQLAEQAASQTTMITYDFVGRTQVVPLVPRFAYQPQQQQQQQTAAAGGEQHQNNNNNNGRGRNSQHNNGRRLPAPARGGGAGGANEQGHVVERPRSESPATTGNTPSATATATTTASTDSEEADGKLRLLVHEKLNKTQEKEFQTATVAFLKEQSKALEYFKHLQRLFPDRETLETVCEYMSQTLKTHSNQQLREALAAVKNFELSAEAQRRRQAEEDEERAKRQAEIKEMHRATLKGGKSPVVKSHAGGNVWSQRAVERGNNGADDNATAKGAGSSQPSRRWGPSHVESVWAGSASAAATASSGPPAPASNNNNGNKPASPVSGGNGAVAAAASPSLEEAFPTLNTTTRRGAPHPNQPPKPKGAWKNNRLLG